MSRALIIFLLLLLSIHPAHAIAVPPAALDEQTVSPACITVKPSYIFGQAQVYGTDGKGPAVRIENGCAEAVTVENIQTGMALDALKLVPSIDVLVAWDKTRVAAPYDFIFMPARRCSDEFREAHERELEKQRAAYAAYRGKLHSAESSEAMLEELSKGAPPKPDLRTVLCEEISIDPGGYVTLAMPWETHYLVTGKPGVKISGQMINPLDVNSPETFQFAQNGDKATRHMLALHNIETGQNLKIALRWLNEAAEQGYRPALYQLSQCYETGKCGVAKDAEEAFFWLSLASDTVMRAQLERQITYARRQFVNQRIDEWQKTHPEVTDY